MVPPGNDRRASGQESGARVGELTPLERRRLTGPGLRAFFRIAEAWRLDPHEQMKLLGVTSPTTFLRWRKGAVQAVNAATLERISLCVGIFKLINILFSVPARADDWMRKPNSAPLFRGRSAIDVMLEGDLDGLYTVRRCLNAMVDALIQ